MTGNTESGTESYRELQLANRTLGARNAKLVSMLQASRNKLEEINGRLEALAEPPSTYGTLLAVGAKGLEAEVFTANRRMRVPVSPLVDRSAMQPGATVRLAEGQQVAYGEPLVTFVKG